jgi:gamma-F420-2:alpha-L-glutamate ligase
MRIWILDKRENFKSYENTRFRKEAERENVKLKLVAPEEFEIIVTKEGKKSILYKGKEVELPDCLIPRMGSGTTYFALAVIRHLERLGVPVLNRSRSIEHSRDKLETSQDLAARNIPTPKTMLAKFPLNIDFVEKEFSYPLIVKTISGTHGKGVFLCNNREQLEDLAELMEVSKDPKVNVIIQEFVSSSTGKDIRVIVIGGRAIGGMLRKAREGKFKANVSAGASVELFKLDPAVEWLAVESARLLGLDIAGVDLLFDGDHYKICEVNSSPQFRGFEQATKLNVPAEIYDYIKVRFGE